METAVVKRRWFGTDGIRGLFGKEPITEQFAARCGYAAASFFNHTKPEPLFIVGRDTRDSGPRLEEALVAGLQQAGARVERIGVLPTAAVAAYTCYKKAAAGVMISASHNPYKDNGIKFFGADGFKLNDQQEVAIEQLIEMAPAVNFQEGKGNFYANEEAFYAYKNVLFNSLPAGFSLKGLTIVTDLANGSAWHSTPAILRELGSNVVPIHNSPNGKNINEGCGSLHIGDLKACVKETPGSIGLAHDGDADRLVLVDETGEVLDGDEILAIVGVDALQQGALAQQTLVATHMSNLGLDDAIRQHGGCVVRTDVGDRYVLEEMRRQGYCIGGEQSGHMLFLNYFPTGDGLLTAIQVFKVMVRAGQPLKQLRQVMRRYPQWQGNYHVSQKKPFEEIIGLNEILSTIKNEWSGRVLLRYSGTENKVRLLVEGPQKTELPAIAQKILTPLESIILKK